MNNKTDKVVATVRNANNSIYVLEKQLIEESINGNSESFSKLYEPLYQKLHGTILSMVRNIEDTEDILQESAKKAYKSLVSFKGESSFATWLHRITHNTAVNFIRKKKQMYKVSIDDTESKIETDEVYLSKTTEEGCDKKILVKELGQKLNEAIEKLPLKQRLVVRYYDIDGLSHREISKIIGINECTVRSRLYYAHQSLQGMLAEYRELI